MAYSDGTFTTWSANGPQIKSFPFGNSAIPDKYTTSYLQPGMVLATGNANATATRTTYTNIALYSEQFNNAVWTKGDTTVSANATNCPDGSLTADFLAETATTAAHYAQQDIAHTSGSSYAMSLFVKANGRSYVQIVGYDTVQTKEAFFNVSTGVVGTTSNCTSAIYDCGNGWYRCAIYYSSAATATGFMRIYISTNGSTTNYAGNTSLGLYLWGAQAEVGTTDGAYAATTSASAAVSAPVLNPYDPLAYLVEESEPQITGPMLYIDRRYARVPTDQITPGNQWFFRPVMHNIITGGGSSYMVSFDEEQKYSWRFDSRKNVSRVSSINASTTTSAMPSSNITFVEGGRTLNLPANSSAATVVSQFNATLTGLTQVSANVSQGFMSVVWTGTMTSVTPPSGVIITQLGSWIATFQSTGTQTTPATTTFEATSHGGVVGDRCALWAGDTLAGTGIVVAVGSANTFSVMTNNLIAANTLVNYCAFSSDATACYVNGPKLCTVKKTRKFYLPGVTSGITTYADIPDVTIYTDPISWLGRIIAVPTGYAAIAVSELEVWRGAILTQEITEVQMSDAIDTVTP